MAKEIELIDLRTKKRFKTTDFRVIESKGRYRVEAKSPYGDYRISQFISKEKAEEMKKW